VGINHDDDPAAIAAAAIAQSPPVLAYANAQPLGIRPFTLPPVLPTASANQQRMDAAVRHRPLSTQGRRSAVSRRVESIPPTVQVRCLVWPFVVCQYPLHLLIKC
jgi:hypothetical protein